MAFVWSKVCTWRNQGFKLTLYDTHVPTGRGIIADTLLAYRFSDRGKVIFAGDGFAPPLAVAIDSDECVTACLNLFTLRPGDLDDEFFDGFTARQRRWVDSDRPDDLGTLVREMESSEPEICKDLGW